MVEESGTLESQLEATKVSAPRAPGSAATLHPAPPQACRVQSGTRWAGGDLFSPWLPVAWVPTSLKSLGGLLPGALLEKEQAPLVLSI